MSQFNVDTLNSLISCLDDNRPRIPVYAPFTGEQLGTIPACQPVDVEAALHRARQSQISWAKRPYQERAAILWRYHDLLLTHRDSLLDITQIESGKGRLHALEELLDIPLNCRHYAVKGKKYLQPKRRQGLIPLLTAAWEYHHPVGVVGIIAPWNYPLTLAMSDAIPALLAGNSVILKPSEETSLTALSALQLFRQAGLPDDVFQIITGYGPDIGPTLIDGANFICFTGSTATGRIVARQAGQNLIKCSLELGGKNPMVVLNDAVIKTAVEGAIRGCFANAGQLCISFERLYVQDGIYEPFVKALTERTRQLRLYTSLDYEGDIGSLISTMQFDKVQRHVEDARAKGATILAGGEPRPDIGPLFFEPTLLTDVTPNMLVAQEETFGPVVSIYRFSDIDSAIQQANDNDYGLNASIWTANTRLGQQLATRIACGTVNINEAYAATWGSTDAPMGGMKASGMGRRHGAEGILKYTESQTIAVQRLFPLAPLPGMKTATYASLITALVILLKYLRRR